MTKTNDACIACGEGKYVGFKKDLFIETEGGLQFQVPEVGMLRCDSCGDEIVPARSHKYVDNYVADRVEQLTPGDVRDLFGSIDNTQSAICEDLGLGTKTLGRWLSGEQHPNRAMGFYLRAMAEFPQVYCWVKARAWKEPTRQGLTPNMAETGLGLRIAGHLFSNLKAENLSDAPWSRPCNFADDFRTASFSGQER
jgi:YgiT-type zinc finger domain-containing protein